MNKHQTYFIRLLSKNHILVSIIMNKHQIDNQRFSQRINRNNILEYNINKILKYKLNIILEYKLNFILEYNISIDNIFEYELNLILE